MADGGWRCIRAWIGALYPLPPLSHPILSQGDRITKLRVSGNVTSAITQNISFFLLLFSVSVSKWRPIHPPLNCICCFAFVALASEHPSTRKEMPSSVTASCPVLLIKPLLAIRSPHLLDSTLVPSNTARSELLIPALYSPSRMPSRTRAHALSFHLSPIPILIAGFGEYHGCATISLVLSPLTQ